MKHQSLPLSPLVFVPSCTRFLLFWTIRSRTELCYAALTCRVDFPFIGADRGGVFTRTSCSSSLGGTRRIYGNSAVSGLPGPPSRKIKAQ